MAKEDQYVAIDRAVLNDLAVKVLALKPNSVDKKRKRNAHKGLRDLIGPALVAEIESETTPEAQARRLRGEISKILTATNSDKVKSDLATWIVSNWGSVTKGTEKIPGWIVEFGAFDTASIDAFKANKVHRRMSSWTKIISFVHYQKYPIYDANNAVALNVLMKPLSTANFFYMPVGRANYVKHARAKLIDDYKTGRGHYPDLGGYKDYEYLIDQVVKLGSLEDALEAEQLLFNRSIGVAKSYFAPDELAIIEAEIAEKKRLAKIEREAKKARDKAALSAAS